MKGKDNVFCKELDACFSKASNYINRRFKKSIFSLDLRELLNSIKRSEVFNIAVNLNISKISGLSKEDLINRIIEEYEKSIKDLLKTFDKERNQILKEYLNNDGIYYLSKIKLDLFKHSYLLNNGIIMPMKLNEKIGFVMPEKTQEIIKSNNDFEYYKNIKKNTEVLSLFKGLISIYGVLNMEDSKRLLNRYLDIYNYDLMKVLSEGALFYNEVYDIVEYNGELVFISSNLENISQVMDIMNNELDYKLLSKEEILSFCHEDWIDNTSYGKKFIDRFINHFSNKFEVDKIELILNMWMLYSYIQVSNIEELLDQFIESMPFANNNDKTLRKIVKEFMYNIRLWRYRGYSLKELESKEINKELIISVGKNELCPCGSGKKYKRCCGENSNVKS